MIEIKRRGQLAAGRPPGRAQRPQDGLRARKVEDYTPKARASTTVNSGPFTGFEAGRDYRSQYRIAFDLHQRYNPPPPPLGDLARFDADAARAVEASGDDPFLAALLQAIRAELIREAKAAAAREIMSVTPPGWRMRSGTGTKYSMTSPARRYTSMTEIWPYRFTKRWRPSTRP